MFIRFGHLLLILALLAATGGHWTVLQTVAWTNMLATNLRTDSFAEALTKTFDGKNPCRMCHEISTGKKTEKKANLLTAGKQLEFCSERLVFVFSAPTDFRLVATSLAGLTNWSEAPPTPPPLVG